MDYKNLAIGFLVGVIAHSISWFGYNAQFVWEMWKSRPLLAALTFGIPSTFLFFIASEYMFKGVSNLWQVRWFFFAASFIPIYLFNSTLLGEAFLNPRNVITSVLAICIIAVQFIFR